MKIATWNVNGIRSRQERVLAWTLANEVDVLCMQELKCQDDQFPTGEWKTHGYEAAIFGQKAYNGVAIVSRSGLADVARDFGDGGEEDSARLIAATVGDIRIASVYVPNGKSVESEHYQQKLEWLDRLTAWATRHLAEDRPGLVCGDFNVAPEAIDVFDPIAFEGQNHFTMAERSRLLKLQNSLSMTDVLRHFAPEAQLFTWWDYRMLGFPKNRGMRIDHAFATPALMERVTGADRDREARKGKSPSDHCPVILTLK